MWCYATLVSPLPNHKHLEPTSAASVAQFHGSSPPDPSAPHHSRTSKVTGLQHKPSASSFSQLCPPLLTVLPHPLFHNFSLQDKLVCWFCPANSRVGMKNFASKGYTNPNTPPQSLVLHYEPKFGIF